ncbi:acyltransferase domain-containing protein, partial [Nocardia sp. JMUB6875]|uniref:acyltransferase domain-containing protein n=1 Tax=Nocardia sp. JMUB6875 TaxID=3158170 RepID=UPI0034E8EA0F
MSIVGVGCRTTGTDFDHEWFGMDRLEAAGLTPRQRATLEVAVEALDDSGLGCLAAGSQAAVVFGAVGGTNSAHHLSRALDLRGPSLTVDSRRASPLVAVDMGVRLLADPTVPFVIAGGVDLALLPDISDLRLPGARTGPGVCTVLILQRTTDAVHTRTRRYAEIGGPGLGFQEADSLDPHIALHDPANNREATVDRGDEPPVLIPITGRDPATVHNLALRWAVAVGSYRSIREFATATARLVPEDTRAAVLARDATEAATRLRTLASRIRATGANAPAAQLITSAAAASGPLEIFDPPRAQRTGELLFLFPGTGDHPRMGRALAARYPVFATALTAATDAVVNAGGPRVWTPRNGFRPPARAAAGPAAGSTCSVGAVKTGIGHPAAPAGGRPGRFSAAEFGRRDEPRSAHGGSDGGYTDATPLDATHTGRTAAPPPEPNTPNGAIDTGRVLAADRSTGEVTRADSAAPDPVGGAPLGAGRSADTGDGNGSGELVFAHASLFVFQVALAQLLESWGVRADAVAGHGVGEVAAAVCSGALPVQAGARVVVARARLLERVGAAGAAARLEATPAEVARLVEPMSADVAVAAVDGPTTVTVSGEPRYIDALVRRAHRRAIFAQRLAPDAVPQPSHLPSIRARVDELHGALADLEPVAATRRLYSTTRRGAVLRAGSTDGEDPSDSGPPGAGTGADADLRLDGRYWSANAASAVELSSALEHAAAEGISTVLEMGPAAVLTSTVRERAAFRGGAHPVLARDDEAASLLRTLALLYLEGRQVDWTALGTHTAAPPQRQWRREYSGTERRWPDGGAELLGGEVGAPAFPVVEVRPEGTYVVAGG